MKTLIYCLVAAALGQPVLAECQLSKFPQNGLYYSPTGDPDDAFRRGRLKLPKIDGYKSVNYTALKAVDTLQYSPDGRFFLRAGAKTNDYILVLPKKHKEAVLVRSISHAKSAEQASYVSLTRSDLDYGACNSGRSSRQPGLGEDRYFFETNKFVLAHSNSRELTRTPILDKQFHFVFQGSNGCHHTGRITNENGKWASNSAYSGIDQVVVNPKGQYIIEQTAYELAQIFLPSPAFASLPSPGKVKPDNVSSLVVSSVEARLYDITAGEGVCLELSAPIPTGDYSKRWFGGVKADKKAAINAAKKGKWAPVVTEFHFQQIDNKRQSAFVRLFWQ